MQAAASLLIIAVLLVVAHRGEPRLDRRWHSINEPVDDACQIHAMLVAVDVGGDLVADGHARMISLNRKQLRVCDQLRFHAENSLGVRAVVFETYQSNQGKQSLYSQ